MDHHLEDGSGGVSREKVDMVSELVEGLARCVGVID